MSVLKFLYENLGRKINGPQHNTKVNTDVEGKRNHEGGKQSNKKSFKSETNRHTNTRRDVRLPLTETS